jgi:CRP-like cAMP-binding protein
VRRRRSRRPDLSALAGIPPFDRYRGNMLTPLAVNADRLRLAAGTVVARQGRRAREVVVVVAGVLLATHGDRPAGLLGPGSWIGAAEVREERAHGVTLVAGEGLEVLVLTAPAYRWAVQTLPGLAEATVPDLPRAPAALRHPATVTL